MRKTGRFGYLAFYALAVVLAGWFLFTKLREVEAEIGNERLAALGAVRDELSLSMVTAKLFVELMQRTAENELQVRPDSAPPSLLLSALTEDDDGLYSLDTLPPGIAPRQVGNLTGLGGLKDRAPRLFTEIEVALSLRAVFEEAIAALSNVPWAYYVSKNRFEHVYPWVPSSEYAYEDKDLEQEYFVRGAPAQNPDRAPYVTDIYEDDGGKGLMITLGRPVYRGEEFLGIAALDFTLSYIDGVLAKFPDAAGEVYLVERGGRVIGFSMRDDPAQPVELPAAIAGSPLLAAAGDTPAKTVIDGQEVTTQRLAALPFDLVAVAPVAGIYGQVARGAAIEIVICAVVLMLLAFIEWRRRIGAQIVAQSLALQRANADLAVAKDEAEAATRAKSSFLAMMSHEIRTPMNGVMSMAEMLDQTELTADQRGMSSVIRSSAAALLTIINDILDFSKIEAGKLDIERTDFNLPEVVEAAGDLVSQRAEDKGLTLAIVIDPAVPEAVTGDPSRLRQVLLNLMGNAVKFTGAGSVTVRVTPKGEMIRFEVADTGIGLTPEQQGRLFTAFEQADASTSRKYGGTGLGLSISQRLCAMMGGSIGVLSAFGQGATFWFELPLPAAPDEAAMDVADARVLLVGFHGPTRQSMDAILAACGVTQAAHLGADDDVLAHVGGEPTPVVFFLAEDSHGHAFAAAQEVHAKRRAKLVLAAPRGLVSTLNEADRRGFLAALTLPLHRSRVRLAIAAALGRASLSDRAAAADGRRSYEPPPVEEARAAGVLILVAEDNPTNQMVIRRMLSQRGYAIEMADNGLAALRKYQDDPSYGLLLTDFHMPEMDGFELTAAVRAAEQGAARRMPIIALTADALPGTEQKCLAAGMDGYLTKPIDSRLLTATLEKWLPKAAALRRTPQAAAAAPQAAPSAAEVDPQVFDPSRLREVFGSFEGEAKMFLAKYLVDARNMVAGVTAAMAAGDWAAARHHAHALKGSSRSLGAVRLGQLASDVQDCLDADDPATALLFVDGLETTVDELAQAVKPLLART